MGQLMQQPSLGRQRGTLLWGMSSGKGADYLFAINITITDIP